MSGIPKINVTDPNGVETELKSENYLDAKNCVSVYIKIFHVKGILKCLVWSGSSNIDVLL